MTLIMKSTHGRRETRLKRHGEFATLPLGRSIRSGGHKDCSVLILGNNFMRIDHILSESKVDTPSSDPIYDNYRCCLAQEDASKVKCQYFPFRRRNRLEGHMNSL